MEDIADQPEPLPLLSEAMVRTWHRRDGDLLTLEGYRLSGGVGGALEAAAEGRYAQLEEDEQRAARHLLVRLAARSPATGWLRRAVPRANVASERPKTAALAALIATRLVVVSETRIEIAHDAFLLHWPRLRDWLTERTLAADLLQQLDQATTTWRTSGQQVADLYRGPRLTAALGWYAEHPEDVSPIEAEFLDASAGAANAELEAARAQAARDREAGAACAPSHRSRSSRWSSPPPRLCRPEQTSARSPATHAQQSALAADARGLASPRTPLTSPHRACLRSLPTGCSADQPRRLLTAVDATSRRCGASS